VGKNNEVWFEESITYIKEEEEIRRPTTFIQELKTEKQKQIIRKRNILEEICQFL
jgi:hypothetical protein